ncbi:precorrin-2 dehydrogenase/sirohydrochlorin ferrochelatase family protein [Fimbriimonas ginsengisoli]|uniref:precorrin-2 dehydrogenase n=1 Tax=Fimbriimonas ginsengisoli Gsoil 348 TaxID=661478 RepID=A0A068NLC0_FIMGI|nr:bifunctional precorrin-2 dehydrogenase/sirohydrochlorin ferrochelatase [Fimbriimonas ginsengisoli]AIE84373.1 siroheme synthase [Fimbriimonas ginsengisoli Gsoil 348]
MTTYFPVFLELSGRAVLIVGGGPVAWEKVESLKSTGAEITILSPTISLQIQGEVDAGRLVWIEKAFEPADVIPYFMIVAATDDPATNAEVFQTGNALNRLTNSVDDPENCNFIMSAIVRQGPMQVAVSSSGCSPALAQQIRNRISDDLLTPEVGRLGEFLGQWRPAVKSSLGSYKHRQGFWARVLASDVPALLNINETEAGEAMTRGLRWAEEHPECLLCGRHELGFDCGETT